MSERDQLLTAYMDLLDSNQQENARAFFSLLLEEVENPTQLYAYMRFLYLKDDLSPAIKPAGDEDVEKHIVKELLKKEQRQKKDRQLRKKQRLKISKFLLVQRRVETSEKTVLAKKPLKVIEPIQRRSREEIDTIMNAALEILYEMHPGEYEDSDLAIAMPLAAEWARNALLTNPNLYNLSEEQQDQLRSYIELFVINRQPITNEFFQSLISTLDSEKNNVLIQQIVLLFRQHINNELEKVKKEIKRSREMDLKLDYKVVRAYIKVLEKYSQATTLSDIHKLGKRLKPGSFNIVSDFLYQLNLWLMEVLPPDLNRFL